MVEDLAAAVTGGATGGAETVVAMAAGSAVAEKVEATVVEATAAETVVG